MKATCEDGTILVSPLSAVRRLVPTNYSWIMRDLIRDVCTGIRRRGMTIEALTDYMLMQGPSQAVTNLEWDAIWNMNKKVIDPIVPRFVALEKAGLCVGLSHLVYDELYTDYWVTLWTLASRSPFKEWGHQRRRKRGLCRSTRRTRRRGRRRRSTPMSSIWSRLTLRRLH